MEKATFRPPWELEKMRKLLIRPALHAYEPEKDEPSPVRLTDALDWARGDRRQADVAEQHFGPEQVRRA